MPTRAIVSLARGWITSLNRRLRHPSPPFCLAKPEHAESLTDQPPPALASVLADILRRIALESQAMVNSAPESASRAPTPETT